MNKKNLLSLIVAVLFLAVMCVYVFVPINGKVLPGSLGDFQAKAQESRDLNTQMIGLNDSINSVNAELVNKEAELSKVTETSEKAGEMFKELLKKQSTGRDWGYHIPSLLIQLEKLADNSKIKVAMDYTTFKTEGQFVSESKQGLKVVKVKVEVYGVYNDVQRYIRDIEGIEFVSVEELKLTRVGDGDLAGEYFMNVYYLEN